MDKSIRLILNTNKIHYRNSNTQILYLSRSMLRRSIKSEAFSIESIPFNLYNYINSNINEG